MGSVLLITGLPATGKSHFAQFLAREEKFASYDMERYPDGWALPELHRDWEHNRALFVAKLRQRHPEGAVLDWGFPPNCLPWVKELEEVGAQCIWFTGDRERLRERFIARGGQPVQCFDTQIRNIDDARLPDNLTWLAIETLNAQGHTPAWETVWHRIRARE